MCGIVGYVGHKDAVSFILPGLRRLEYRGYDSAGIATVSRMSLDVRKATGKIADLETLLTSDRPQGTLGVGHTRWATHGRPSNANAHPHLDCHARLAVEVRMCVRVRWPAMGGPTRVADAEGTLGPVGGEQGFEIRDLAGRLPDVERHPRNRGNTCRVVAAVLQPTETRKNEGNGILMADVADDSTHRPTALRQPLAGCSLSGQPRCAAAD